MPSIPSFAIAMPVRRNETTVKLLGAHRLNLAADRYGRAARQILLRGIDQLLDIAGDGAQVSVLGGCVDVDGRRDVVVGLHGRPDPALDRADRTQNLRLSSGIAGEWDVAQRIQRVELRLRCLGYQRVRNPALSVEPEGLVGLEAAGQRHEQIVRHFVLRKAQLLRPTAIDRHVEFGIVEILLDVRVGDARDTPDTIQQLLGKGVVAGEVEAPYLHVDRRRCAEVQDLGYDVRRQEGEGHAGEFGRELSAQAADVVGCRGMVFLQRDQDIRVGGAGRRRVAVGQIDAADR
jgi:hypothetical protein